VNAHQDRDIIYYLQAPETHAFSLSHDYTESREGTDKYLNVVRPGSRSRSHPENSRYRRSVEGRSLDRHEVESGEDRHRRRKIAPDQQVVVFRFPAVKKANRFVCA
jgi:hypothetical protein